MYSLMLFQKSRRCLDLMYRTRSRTFSIWVPWREKNGLRLFSSNFFGFSVRRVGRWCYFWYGVLELVTDTRMIYSGVHITNFKSSFLLPLILTRTLNQ